MSKSFIRFYAAAYLAAILTISVMVSGAVNIPSPSVTLDETVNLVRSPYSYRKTIANLKLAINSNNFRVISENVNGSAYTLYFCNFTMAHEAIQSDKRVGVILPCKIKILRFGGQVYVASINIDSLTKQTGLKIGSLCTKIKASINRIVDDAVI